MGTKAKHGRLQKQERQTPLCKEWRENLKPGSKVYFETHRSTSKALFKKQKQAKELNDVVTWVRREKDNSGNELNIIFLRNAKLENLLEQTLAVGTTPNNAAVPYFEVSNASLDLSSSVEENLGKFL